MAYTVGLKKWWGYQKLSVNRHSWENFRFIFDLADGSQLIVPGFKASGVKVYSDFWKHVELTNRARAQQEADELDRARAVHDRAELEEFKRMKSKGLDVVPTAAPVKAKTTEREFDQDSEENYGHIKPEVYQNAVQRVRGILQGADQPGTLPS